MPGTHTRMRATLPGLQGPGCGGAIAEFTQNAHNITLIRTQQLPVARVDRSLSWQRGSVLPCLAGLGACV